MYSLARHSIPIKLTCSRLMQMYHNRNAARARQRQITRQRWLLAGVVVLVVVLLLARQKLQDRHPSAADVAQPVQQTGLDRIHRRSLQEAAADSSRTPIDSWRVIVLTPPDAPADWHQSRIEPALQEVLTPLTLVWHTGSSAAALAPFLGVQSLPAAVLIPPFCTIRTCQEELRSWQPGKQQAAAAPADALAAWITTDASAWVLLANDAGMPVLFWQQPPPSAGVQPFIVAATLDPSKDPDQHLVAAGGREWVRSPLQSIWSAWQGENPTSARPLARHTVVGDAIMTVRHAGECNFFTSPGCQVPRPNKQFSAAVLQERADADDSRMQDIRNQSAIIRRYTSRGFHKRRAPPALYTTLHNYFQAHAAQYLREEWEADDIFVNHDKSQLLLVDMPEAGPMRPAIFAAVQPIFEAWAGDVRLVPTAIYGVRVYTRGSELRDHVDVPETHHVSAILNIDQDVDEPWPLEIFDHGGRAHQALLEPGDMLLYEGASCAHGRPKPLKGNWMANVFIHMAPADGVLLAQH